VGPKAQGLHAAALLATSYRRLAISHPESQRILRDQMRSIETTCGEQRHALYRNTAQRFAALCHELGVAKFRRRRRKREPVRGLAQVRHGERDRGDGLEVSDGEREAAGGAQRDDEHLPSRRTNHGDISG
jgi:hypothetical protein